MARLRFKNSRPPRGFSYVQPETRAKIEAENYNKLMSSVLAHRKYKGLDRATADEVILDVERQICTRLSVAECSPEGPDDQLRPVTESQTLSIHSVLKFSTAALGWLKTGAKVVSMEQLKQRQEICKACPLNQPVKACNCSSFYKMVNALVPADRRDQDMHVCGACGCSLQAKSQMPIEMVLKADDGRDIQYPKLTCWVALEKEAMEKPKG